MHSNIASVIVETFSKDLDKIYLKSYKRNVTYNGHEAIECFDKISLGLIAEGCQPLDRVAIYSQNCPEWSLVDIGCMQAHVVSVPIYATNGASDVAFILNDAQIDFIFAGEQAQYDELLKIENHEQFRIVVFDENVELVTENSIYFSKWLSQNHDNSNQSEFENRKNNIDLDDLATLIYTSGTTGKPKGVKLNHRQFVSSIENHNKVYDFKSEYTSLAFLPLSHVFERGWCYIILSNGMTNVYLNDPKTVAEALKEVKPNTFCAVPRLYEKIYAKVHDELGKQSKIKKGIFKWAIEQGKKRVLLDQEGKSIPIGLAFKNKIADKLVFRKIRENLGGQLEMCPCGGAYIADNLVLFFRAIGVPMLVGYGLSETVATVTSFRPNVYKVGTVGKPLVNVDVKIGEHKEILVKADSVTPGYYNLEEETKAHFTEDGWFKTGDAGHIDKDGFLVITDRIKQLIKTANGKYIAPQLVEGNLNQCYFVSQSMVIGEGKSYACALLTLDREYADTWAKNHNVQYSSYEDLFNNETYLKALKKSIDRQQVDLSPHERAKKYKLLPEEFTMEKNQLTPTLKVKRKVILEQFKDEIDELYGSPKA